MKKLIFTVVVALFSVASFAQLRSKSTNVTTYGGHDGTITLDIRGGTPPYFYEWSNGSNDDKLTNLCSGVYTCSITDQHSCTYTLGFNITEPQVGGNNKSNGNRFTSSFQLYPNPSFGQVHVKFSSQPNTGVNVRVIDVNGKVVMENNYTKSSGDYESLLDLSQQPKGLYFIQVKSDQEVVNQKILIN